MERSREAYKFFRNVPAPKRGEILRQIREALAAKVGLTCAENHEAGVDLVSDSEKHWVLSFLWRWARSAPRASVRFKSLWTS